MAIALNESFGGGTNTFTDRRSARRSWTGSRSAATSSRPAAAAGHAAGLRTFGFMLVRGKGVEEDRDEALELFRAAAAKGDAYGAFNAAVTQGKGDCRADRDAYLRLLTQAADGGITKAAALLGDELAADRRNEEALSWYVRAAENGHAGAADVAADWYWDRRYGSRPRAGHALAPRADRAVERRRRSPSPPGWRADDGRGDPRSRTARGSAHRSPDHGLHTRESPRARMTTPKCQGTVLIRPFTKLRSEPFSRIPLTVG